MIINLLLSLLPILISLIGGWGFGYMTNYNRIKIYFIRSITALVWMLLISIGFQFSNILSNKVVGISIFFNAFIYATILTIVTFSALFKRSTTKNLQKKSRSEILKPLLECLIAILMISIGIVLNHILPNNWNSETLSNILLYVLIFLVGIDLSTARIHNITLNHLKIPLFTIFSLFISAFLTTLVLDKSFVELIVLGSGFGWFSLSGPLIGKMLGLELGTFSLITDLIREFYAIVLLYIMGRNYSDSAIGVCGATAMDSTLPFIKSNCSQLDVQIAIFSGFILTVLAPFFIIFFSTLL